MRLDHVLPLAINEQERGPDRAAQRTVEAVATRARGSRILFNTTGHECAFLRSVRFGGTSALNTTRTHPCALSATRPLFPSPTRLPSPTLTCRGRSRPGMT